MSKTEKSLVYEGFLKIDDSMKMEELPMEEEIKKMMSEFRPMELKDTIDLMTSADWKDRFLAEYLQTKIRYEKLNRLIVKRMVGKIYFETPIPMESWREQALHMGGYLLELEKQAALHGIELPSIV